VIEGTDNPNTVTHPPSEVPETLISQPADLATAGAIGTTYDPKSLPKIGQADIQTVVTSAAQVAISAATSPGATSSADTQTAVTALAHGLTQIGEVLATQYGGPIAGAAAEVVVPEFATAIADGLTAVMSKIGMEIPQGLAKLTSWFEKL
jgi:hypothetical protein